ncbi:trypsin-like serine peptidase [Spirillospora sp. CA-294931]|uniref:trypsin-like serine peptidase n=1 Tax=Spirillospora sp. CA-294931 TaxID=3240042 RepID=UPI003D9495D7
MRRRTLVPVIATTLATGAAAGALAPEPGSPPPAAPDLAARAVLTSPDAVRRYWTPGRMRAAERTAKPTVTHAERAAWMRARRGVAEAEPAARSERRLRATRTSGARAGASGGALWTGGGVVARTTGKVFFTIGGRDSLCSAGTVRSANRDVVVTAAHCVKPPGQGWAENWIFVPGYRDGASPYGGFTARRIFAPDQWTRDGNGDFDVAFVALSPADGRHVVDAVGGLPITFGGPDGQPAHAFGYPSAAPYNGERLAYCDGRPARDPNAATAGRGLRCDMTRGSSGGPWLTGFDPSTGGGTVASVSSFKYANDGGTLYGPRFGDAVRRLYERARTA